MANIGSFKKVGNEFQGEIVTLSVQTKGVRIVPETSRGNDNAPSHRVYVGRAEIGAAWSKRSNEGRDYLSVKLDDPSFNAPIYANLFDDEDGEGFTLIAAASPTATDPDTTTPRPASGRGFLAHRYGRVRHASSFPTVRHRAQAPSLPGRTGVGRGGLQPVFRGLPPADRPHRCWRHRRCARVN
jgi:uncharacterized protein (DUF736 family)